MPIEINQNKELKPIDVSDFFEYGRYEGAPSLIFKGSDIEPEYLMGHLPVFYKNGVLLVLSDDAKDFPDKSRSFMFYNNQHKMVFKIHNRNAVNDPETNRFLRFDEPIKDIDIKVFEDFLYVTITSYQTGEKEEFIVDILTKEKTHVSSAEINP